MVWFRSVRRRVGLVLLAALTAAGGAPAAEPAPVPPTVVFVLRHAEKATEPKGDPALSEIGARRAARLAELLAPAGVTALFASEWRRTQDTLAPLAAKLSLPVRAIPAAEPTSLAQAILAQTGGVAVVAAHSNTIGPILEALGASPIAEIPETDYDNLFIATIAGPGKVRVVRLLWSP